MLNHEEQKKERDKIRVVFSIAGPIQNTIYLIHDNWDDWFKFETAYKVVYYNAKLEEYQVMDYDFIYRLPSELAEDGAQLSFNVECEAKPPPNIHVLIGKDGAGNRRHLNRSSFQGSGS